MFSLVELFKDELLLFVLVLTRISGVVMTAPIFGSRNVPVRVRAFLAIGLAMIVTPIQWHDALPLPDNLIELSLLVGRELLLGLSLGLAVMILFAGLHLTGQIMGQMSGMQLADAFDPTFNSSIPMFSQLLDVITLAVFVAIGGHRQVIGALLETFRYRPPGQLEMPENIVETLTAVTGESFIVGIRASAPILVALLMAIVILGLISRTLPQLNVLAVGFSLNAMVMLLILGVSMGAIAWVVQERADHVIETVRDVLIE